MHVCVWVQEEMRREAREQASTCRRLISTRCSTPNRCLTPASHSESLPSPAAAARRLTMPAGVSASATCLTSGRGTGKRRCHKREVEEERSKVAGRGIEGGEGGEARQQGRRGSKDGQAMGQGRRSGAWRQAPPRGGGGVSQEVGRTHERLRNEAGGKPGRGISKRERSEGGGHSHGRQPGSARQAGRPGRLGQTR
jgi:hypothetical protein